MHRPAVAAAPGVVAAMCAAALAGCSQGPGGISGIGSITAAGPLPYQHSSAFMPAGYSESIIGPDRYRIEVKGPIGTPRDRLEKIAATRAAEIGKDGKFKYFKVDAIQQSNTCKTYRVGGKPGSIGSGDTKTSALTILTADVTYAKAPADPTYLESKATFERYRAELDQDQTPPPPVAPGAPACS
jgi:hypothetical protein